MPSRQLTAAVMRRVGAFDRWVETRVEPTMRKSQLADRVFYTASSLGDHGIIWLILAVIRGLRSKNHLRATLRCAAAVGLESMLVNGPVKWVFRRERPVQVANVPLPLRRPRTSSFPSGHATSAFCAAALLSDGDPALRPLYYSLAVVVAWSRVHVRVHHASDVLGGVVIGVALGEMAKRVAPLPRPTAMPLTRAESPGPDRG
jgi:undecaprenyl-diphosphatase